MDCAHRVHGGRHEMCSKCAHSVRRGCTEHAREHVEPMEKTHMEHAAKAAQSVHCACVECSECSLRLHGLCDRASPVCVLQACAESMQRAPVQSVHGAWGVNLHTAFARNTHAACGECAKRVSREGVCSARTKHTQNVHGVCGKSAQSEQLSVLRACARVNPQCWHRACVEPAVSVQRVHVLCLHRVCVVCVERASTKQLSMLGACTRTRGAHTLHAQRPCMHTCVREHGAHPPWHSPHACSRTCAGTQAHPRVQHTSGGLNRGLPPACPAPQLQCPLNVGWKPWSKHCPFAMVGFSVKIPRFWGT